MSSSPESPSPVFYTARLTVTGRNLAALELSAKAAGETLAGESHVVSSVVLSGVEAEYSDGSSWRATAELHLDPVGAPVELTDAMRDF